MEKTPNGWKVYDVKVGGVSLVTTYRDTFASEVRERGVDGLIKSLSTKNRQPERSKAGKTTLISVLAGLARADRGSARVMGHDVRADYRAARRSLGVVPQELVFDPFFTVRETLRIQSGYFGVRDNGPWIEEVMQHLDLASKAEVNMRALSGGMKRRVLVAQALVHKPPVIVLDEPTAGVDVELRQALWQFIRRLNRDGHTIVLTTHYLEEAEALCERIAMLKQGRVVA